MNPHRPTILIVEDDHTFCWILGSVFEEAGYQTLPLFVDSETGIGLPEDQPVAAIVNIMLPDDAGYLALRVLKQIAAPTFPVLAVSGSFNERNRRWVKELGADELFEMPFNYDDFVVAVYRRCRPGTD
jgi:DNA-binding response OmpR family regulator